MVDSPAKTACFLRDWRGTVNALPVPNFSADRLAYDAGLPEETRKTWTIDAPEKGAPLLREGFLGPVCIRISQLLELE